MLKPRPVGAVGAVEGWRVSVPPFRVRPGQGRNRGANREGQEDHAVKSTAEGEHRGIIG